ncbi:MAG: bifunctional folylpolyglutamate synthase/dihydrofolate synthase, partial [Lachnospiraceae bacterium]|nr:bifunctional folylpolyglutamate synthase/dihydrofolate synthase [Lachnospiraceae bacterium]
MTEKQITEYREYLKTLGSVPGLDSIRALCGRLGNPQDALSFIHVAGTNGKGSVGTFLSYGLAA